MATPIPPIQVQPSTSIEIKDSCDCSCGSTCWPKKKHRHIKKANAQVDVRVVDVAKRKIGM
jgi:hypothetical protein